MIDSLTLTTLFLCALLAFYCLTSERRSRSKKILSFFFGLIALQAGFKYLAFNTTFIHSNPWLLLLPELAGIATPAVIYSFVLSLVGAPISSRTIIRMSALPIFATIVFTVLFFLTNGFTKDAYYVVEGFVLILIMTLVSYIVYAYHSFRLIRKAVTDQGLQINNHTLLELVWIRILLVLLIMRAVGGIVYFVFQLTSGTEPWFPLMTEIHKITVAAMLLFGVMVTAYYALRNPGLFDSIADRTGLEQSLAMSILPDQEKKAIKKELCPKEIEYYLNLLRSIILNEKLYLNCNLSTIGLSEKTGIPAYKITRYINTGLGKNFNEYINAYRIEHAKKLLADPANQKQTIFSVALESGFASEAPFYGSFKRIVGMSPSAYRSQIQREQRDGINTSAN